MTVSAFTEAAHALVAPWGTEGGYVDDALARLGLQRKPHDNSACRTECSRRRSPTHEWRKIPPNWPGVTERLATVRKGPIVPGAKGVPCARVDFGYVSPWNSGTRKELVGMAKFC